MGYLEGNVSMQSWGWSSHDAISVLIRRATAPAQLRPPLSLSPYLLRHPPSPSCEGTARKQESTSQEESPHQQLNWLASWVWTSGLQNHGEIFISGISSPVYDILLWQPACKCILIPAVFKAHWPPVRGCLATLFRSSKGKRETTVIITSQKCSVFMVSVMETAVSNEDGRLSNGSIWNLPF